MITDRPKYLVDQDDYKKLPGKAFSVHFDALPELVRHALGPLGGIQPITGEMPKRQTGNYMTRHLTARSSSSKK
jgi:hypothetical protein